MNNDTIFALSTILGKSGVAVIRISGPLCKHVGQQFGVERFMHHQSLRRCTLLSISDRAIIDECMVAYFQAPNSFTGEDILEFQTHGSIAVVKKVLEELADIEGCRIAEPGEFSKRAFLNEKMDLVIAEGLADLIESETEMQRQIAMRQFKGEQSALYSKWREDVLSILSQLEALIDFPADDIPEDILGIAQNRVLLLSNSMSAHVSQGDVAEVLHRGIKVAIVGAPNAGKSTLINALARRDVAIVSDIAGTTRDVIEVRLDLKGYPFIVFDTAGIRESEDLIEIEGVRRSISTLQSANFCIHLVDSSNKESSNAILEEIQSSGVPFINVYNKVDLLGEPIDKRFNGDGVHASLLQGVGLEEIIKILIDFAVKHYTPSSDPLLSSIRHRRLIGEAIEHLDSFSTLLPLEVGAEHIRRAAESLSQIIGKIDVDELLGIIFSSFCIGK